MQAEGNSKCLCLTGVLWKPPVDSLRTFSSYVLRPSWSKSRKEAVTVALTILLVYNFDVDLLYLGRFIYSLFSYLRTLIRIHWYTVPPTFQFTVWEDGFDYIVFFSNGNIIYIQFIFNYVMQDFNFYDKYCYWYNTFQSNILC